MTNKALIAMSGGVDSSVAAFLTKDMGYDATGITLKLFDNEDIGEKREKTCCSLMTLMMQGEFASSLAFPTMSITSRTALRKM